MPSTFCIFGKAQVAYVEDTIVPIKHIDLILVFDQHHVSKWRMNVNIIHASIPTYLVASAFQLTMYGLSDISL